MWIPASLSIAMPVVCVSTQIPFIPRVLAKPISRPEGPIILPSLKIKAFFSAYFLARMFEVAAI